MGIVRYTILIIMVFFLLPDTCRTIPSTESIDISSSQTEKIESFTPHLFHSLLALMYSGGMEYMTESFHTNVDKKILRVVPLLNDGHSYFPHNLTSGQRRKGTSFYDPSHSIDYIYILEEIII